MNVQLGLAAVVVSFIPAAVTAQVLFVDDFENGLDGWEIYGEDAIQVVASGDDERGQVLVLQPNGDVHALIRGSSSWRGVRVEGEALFCGFFAAVERAGRRR